MAGEVTLGQATVKVRVSIRVREQWMPRQTDRKKAAFTQPQPQPFYGFGIERHARMRAVASSGCPDERTNALLYAVSP